MARVRLETSKIVDWPSFHAECRRAIGFPQFYGANMNAWIDCLSYLREVPETNLSGVRLGSKEVLELELPDVKELRRRLPTVVEALLDCTAAVNRRYLERGELPALTLLPA